jgi:hypothetical protein
MNKWLPDPVNVYLIRLLVAWISIGRDPDSISPDEIISYMNKCWPDPINVLSGKIIS